MEQHGYSLHTLFQNCSDTPGPCILALEDEYGCIYGAFMSEKPCAHSRYYGNGSCFLWKKARDSFSVYLSTGENEYYILSKEQEYLAFGGGFWYIMVEMDILACLSTHSWISWLQRFYTLRIAEPHVWKSSLVYGEKGSIGWLRSLESWIIDCFRILNNGFIWIIDCFRILMASFEL